MLLLKINKLLSRVTKPVTRVRHTRRPRRRQKSRKTGIPGIRSEKVSVAQGTAPFRGRNPEIQRFRLEFGRDPGIRNSRNPERKGVCSTGYSAVPRPESRNPKVSFRIRPRPAPSRDPVEILNEIVRIRDSGPGTRLWRPPERRFLRFLFPPRPPGGNHEIV